MIFIRPRLPHPTNLTERFANIIMVARYAVAEAQFTKGLDTAVAWLIARYLERVVTRFKRLLARAKEGTLEAPAKPRKPAEGAEDAGPRKRRPRPKPLIRMSGYCWIARHAQGAAAAGNYLRRLIDEDQELIALIMRHKQFPAPLRPLLAAFATVPEPGSLLAPPPKAAPEPKPPKPRKPRARKVKWRCAKPPRSGLEFYDPKSKIWHQ
jgi:hypothetical protein